MMVTYREMEAFFFYGSEGRGFDGFSLELGPLLYIHARSDFGDNFSKDDRWAEALLIKRYPELMKNEFCI